MPPGHALYTLREFLRRTIPLTGFSRARVSFRKAVPAQPVDATPPDMNLHLKGGVYDPSETGKAFGGTER